MRIELAVALGAALLGFGCRSLEPEPALPPETLGALPDDLPLPPGFRLDPASGDSWLDLANRRADIHLAGRARPAEVIRFFENHFRLARWKVSAQATEGESVFCKGEDVARVTVHEDDGETRARVRWNVARQQEGGP
jgi:hypothetical protein